MLNHLRWFRCHLAKLLLRGSSWHVGQACLRCSFSLDSFLPSQTATIATLIFYAFPPLPGNTFKNNRRKVNSINEGILSHQLAGDKRWHSLNSKAELPAASAVDRNLESTW